MNHLEGGVYIPTVRLVVVRDENQNPTNQLAFESNSDAWEAMKNRNGGQVWLELVNGSMTEYIGLWNVKFSQVIMPNSNSNYYLSLWCINLYDLDGTFSPRIAAYTTELTNWMSGGTPTMSAIKTDYMAFANIEAVNTALNIQT